MTKRELIDMFKNIIFPKQAEDLLKINYEGLGELDKREYLRDTSILIMLAEKGLKSEQEVIKPYLNKIRAEIEQKLEQEEFARSVFRHEEKDYTKAEQCTGSIMAYRNVLKMFDKYREESEEENDREPEKAD